MYVYITEELFKAVDDEAFWKKYQVTGEDWRWRHSSKTGIHIPSYSAKALKRLKDKIEPHQIADGLGVRGAKTIVQDISRWLRALGGEAKRPRSMEQFRAMLDLELRTSGINNSKEGRHYGPRLYNHDDERGVWYCYYVGRTEFHEASNRQGDYTPAHTSMNLVYVEFEERDYVSETFWPEDIRGMTVLEALAKKGYILETEELWGEYCRRDALFQERSGKVGKQFLAVGMGSDDCDGNGDGRSSTWYWRRANNVKFDKAGEPSRVVVDVFFEDDKSERNRRSYRQGAYTNRLFWYAKKPYDLDDDADVDECTLYDTNIDPDDIPEPFIPIHPTMAVFDMRRHLRLRADVGQLTEYVYDNNLNNKLVLPSDSRNLVEMLLAHRGQFRDIVKGKSGGAVILCAGIPGTGKTLTAEVYAEVMHKPLYTVQASQLGTKAEALEEELLKTFARAQRWSAIMLLDEADVYVHSRGDDLEQNAIVGVFLRVLEYYKGVLFMTTNRSDLVDDAIASRCVARIDYGAPTVGDQKAIWRILADTAGVVLHDEVINAAAERYPDLTGRDVKNLLKLSELISSSRNCPITLDIIRFAKRFKPTVRAGSIEHEDDAAVTLPPIVDCDPLPDEECEIAEDAHTVTQADNPKPVSKDAVNWRTAVADLFLGGAPHSASEVKDVVAGISEGVHPNAVTNELVKLTRSGALVRLDSGLYRKKEST